MSVTRIPITLVRWLRRLCATMLDSYPSSSITACTRARVSAATPYRPLITFDTVAMDTPAPAATSGSGAGSAPQKLVWWHNANVEPGRAFWQTVADEYHAAHPNVTIEVVPFQNEDFKTKIPIALQSTSPPDVFQQWGGGQMADQVAAGKLMDITAATRSWIGDLGPAAAGWTDN